MDASTETDAVLRAVRERQHQELEARIDVAARLDDFKARLDTGWWDDLRECRGRLITEAAGRLSPSPGDAAGHRGTAERIVDRSFREALDHLPELHRLPPAKREQWLLVRTLEHVLDEVRERASARVPRTKRA